jgi:deoxyribodipyrimidine photo-lyase
MSETNQVHPNRVNHLNNLTIQKQGPVVYWMSRDQRTTHNWALLFAYHLAIKHKKSFCVVFTLDFSYPEATFRSFHFLLNGLKRVEEKLLQLNIPFKILCGNPTAVVNNFIEKYNASALITDFDPLRIKKQWINETLKNIEIPFYQVDAHNIVPCNIASQKAEFGARFLRVKINRLLQEYLTEFPILEQFPNNDISCDDINNWEYYFKEISKNAKVYPVNWIIPNEDEALMALDEFIQNKLPYYQTFKNNPNKDFTSKLSPYIHFGQISAQYIALRIINSNAPEIHKEGFLEELIVRRELSDNYCYYNDNYDNFDGFPTWAKQTLNNHKKDIRNYRYSITEFENAATHENLWNITQKKLVNIGYLHGYMRMYWAKKILEWAEFPEEAIYIANYLNDKYSLDGRDPNGYTGCAWSIGGVHDRAWNEKNIFGKIRYMNANGCKRKFNIDLYCNQ